MELLPFHLDSFKKGHPAITKSGKRVTFVAITPGIPAPLLVEIEKIPYNEAVGTSVNGREFNIDSMENYFLNGSFLGVHGNCDLDLFLQSQLVEHKTAKGEQAPHFRTKHHLDDYRQNDSLFGAR